MSEKGEEQQKAEELKERLNNLLMTTGKKGFLKRGDWGSVHFKDSEETVHEGRKLWTELSGTNLALVGGSVLGTLEGHLNQVENAVAQIEAFSVEEGEPAGRRDSIASSLEAAHKSLLEAAGPWLGFLMYREGDIEGKLQEVREAREKADAEMEAQRRKMEEEQAAHRRQMEKDLAEVRKLKEEYKQTAKELVLGTFTEDFGNESKAAGRQAWWWLGAAVAAGVGAGVWLGDLVRTIASTTDGVGWETMASYAASGGFLVYVSGWCGQMFRALKHQQATNQHRALSLKTVQAFAAAAKSEEAKEAILIGAAKCIFEGRATGLGTEAPPLPTTTTQIIERARKGAG